MCSSKMLHVQHIRAFYYSSGQEGQFGVEDSIGAPETLD